MGNNKIGEGIRDFFHGFGQVFEKFFTKIGLSSVGETFGDFFTAAGGFVAAYPAEYGWKRLYRDIGIAGVSEGEDLPLVLGESVRVPGACVQVGKIIKHVVTDEGGKGSGTAPNAGEQPITKADVLYLVCENPIEDIKEMRGASETLWRSDVTIVTGSSLIYAYEVGKWGGGYPKLVLESSGNGPYLKMFEVGVDVLVEGFADSENNGIWRVAGKKFSKKFGWTRLKLKDLTKTKAPSTSVAGPVVTLSQDVSDLKKGMISATVLTGDASQTEVAELLDFEPLTPAYRGRGGFFCNGLNVTRIGTVANVAFWVQERSTTLTLAQCVDEIMARRTNLDPSQWDTSALSGTVRGIVVGPSSGFDALQPLMQAFDFTWRDVDGVATFIHRGAGDTYTVDADEIGAVVAGNSLIDGYPASLNERDLTDLPTSVEVVYSSYYNDQLRATARHQRFDLGSHTNSVRIDLSNLVMTHAEAKALAKRELYAPEGRRTGARFQLPQKYAGIKAEDELLVTISDDVYTFRVQRVEEEDNGLLIVDGYTVASDPTQQVAPDIITNPSTDDTTHSMTVVTIACGGLKYSHLDQPGFYLIAARDDTSSAGWKGATLYKRRPDNDGGYEYEAVENYPYEGIVGRYVESESVVYDSITNNSHPLPKPHMLDRYTQLVVEMTNEEATLESTTIGELLAGKNRLVWGKELIGYMTVEDLGGGKYKLTNLLRGLRDTADWILAPWDHIDGEAVAVVDQQGLLWREETMSALKTVQTYKLVPVDALIEDVPEFEVDFSSGASTYAPTISGNLTPFRPAAPRISNYAIGGVVDIDITIVPSTRALADVLRGSEPPILEPSELYEVTVQGGVGSPRTFTSDDFNGRTVTYTAAQQIADGWNTAILLITHYQVSPSLGKGKPGFAVAIAGNIYTS